MSKLLLTGFEPYGGDSENVSWAVAEEVTALGVDGVDIGLELMPVSFNRVGSALRRAVALHHPDFVVMLGQTRVASCVKLERVALNLMDSERGDNDGYKPDERPIDPLGEAARFTTVSIKKVQAALKGVGVESVISNSGGLYVCNCLYYQALKFSQECSSLPIIFVHLPSCKGLHDTPSDLVSKPFEELVLAVRTIIQTIYESNQI